MFAIYVNDMMEGVDSYMSLFADDAKLMSRVRNDKDCYLLQKSLDTVWKWSRKWEMEFNIGKCIVMESEKTGRRVEGHYNLGNNKLDRKTEEKDLGVLSLEKHVNKITAETYNLLRNTRAAFTHLYENIVRKLIVTLI